MIKFLIRILTVFCATAFLSFCTEPSLPTVDSVDIDRFMGTWYEIAALPTTYNKGCSCSKVDMEMSPDHAHIRMINSCIKKEKQGAVLAKAFIRNNSGNARMRVQMFWPFRSDYFIVALAEDYSYAMVCNPNRTSLQILSREKVLDDKIFEELIAKALILGFETSAISKTNQVCE